MTNQPFDPASLYNLDAVLSEPERQAREAAQTFVAEFIRPDVTSWYDSGNPPVRDLAKQLGSRGMLGMHLTDYGCAGATATEYGLTCLELEAGDSGIRSLVSVQGSLAMHAIHAYGAESLREQWLPGLAAGDLIGSFALTEPDVGSNPAEMRTTARQDGSDWVLTGEKAWVTNGPVADVIVVWANSPDGVRGFAVPAATSGVELLDVPGKMSLRASATAHLRLTDVRVPADALLDVVGLRGPLSCLNEARFGIVFGALGAAMDCLQSALDYSLARKQFDKPIAGFQLTQQKLADMAVALGNGMLLAIHLGRLKEQGALRPQQISAGKLNSARTALDIARKSRTILGANGVTAAHPVMRHANNLESVVTYEGTAEMHTLVVGQALTGIAAFE